MQIDARTAVVDNDFVNHLAETQMDTDRLIRVLDIVFSELDLSAVMHPLVYEYELLKKKKEISVLFAAGVIDKAEFEDIFSSNPQKESYYIYLVENLYRSLMGEGFPIPRREILTRWIRGKSLGEVHSMAMCLICGCGIFLSDDGDSKILQNHIARMSIGKIEVYSRDEFINKHLQDGVTKLNRKERQALTHSASH